MGRRDHDIQGPSSADDIGKIDILAVNRRAWDRQVAQGNQWMHISRHTSPPER